MHEKSRPSGDDECPGLNRVERRVRVLENGHDALISQISDITVQQQDMTERLEQAVERALTNAIDKAVERLQTKAAERTGMWLWGTVKAVFSRWILVAVIVVMVGKMAGWQAASAVFDAILGREK